jgi:hypothetical protein
LGWSPVSIGVLYFQLSLDTRNRHDGFIAVLTALMLLLDCDTPKNIRFYLACNAVSSFGAEKSFRDNKLFEISDDGRPSIRYANGLYADPIPHSGWAIGAGQSRFSAQYGR